LPATASSTRSETTSSFTSSKTSPANARVSNARALLTLAFAGEVLEEVKLDVVSERVELAVAGKLPERFNLTGLVEAASALSDQE